MPECQTLERAQSVAQRLDILITDLVKTEKGFKHTPTDVVYEVYDIDEYLESHTSYPSKKQLFLHERFIILTDIVFDDGIGAFAKPISHERRHNV